MEKETDKLAEMFPEKKDEVFTPEKEEEKPENKEPELSAEQLEEIKNRRTRRLEAKYQAEREANIALNARLQAISESQKFRQETNVDDVDKLVERIYGTDKPENAEATRILQEALKKSHSKAVDEALEKFREEQEAREGEVAKEEETLDSMVETIEDEYGVDLTSRTTDARKNREGFFDLLERLSPKRNGEIVEYADPIETWELYRGNMKTNNRSKELASRSMTRSGASGSEAENKAQEKWLIENGLI